MFEAIYYIGMVLAVLFFAASVILFIRNRIPAVIRYLLKMSAKKVPKVNNAIYKAADKNNFKGRDSTEILKTTDEPAEMLDVAHQYATALLDADSTTILPSLDEENEECR